jgi:hypothetical protein
MGRIKVHGILDNVINPIKPFAERYDGDMVLCAQPRCNVPLFDWRTSRTGKKRDRDTVKEIKRKAFFCDRHQRDWHRELFAYVVDRAAAENTIS